MSRKLLATVDFFQDAAHVIIATTRVCCGVFGHTRSITLNAALSAL